MHEAPEPLLVFPLARVQQSPSVSAVILCIVAEQLSVRSGLQLLSRAFSGCQQQIIPLQKWKWALCCGSATACSSYSVQRSAGLDECEVSVSPEYECTHIKQLRQADPLSKSLAVNCRMQ